jgi:hypothetical protein
MDWKIKVRSADRLAETLQENFKLALLFRDLATLGTKEPKIRSPNQIRWTGPKPDFEVMCKRLDDARLASKVAEIARGNQPDRQSRHVNQ